MSVDKEFEAMLKARSLVTISRSEAVRFRKDFKDLVAGLIDDRLTIVERLSTAREGRSWEGVDLVTRGILDSIDGLQEEMEALVP